MRYLLRLRNKGHLAGDVCGSCCAALNRIGWPISPWWPIIRYILNLWPWECRRLKTTWSTRQHIHSSNRSWRINWSRACGNGGKMVTASGRRSERRHRNKDLVLAVVSTVFLINRYRQTSAPLLLVIVHGKKRSGLLSTMYRESWFYHCRWSPTQFSVPFYWSLNISARSMSLTLKFCIVGQMLLVYECMKFVVDKPRAPITVTSCLVLSKIHILSSTAR